MCPPSFIIIDYQEEEVEEEISIEPSSEMMIIQKREENPSPPLSTVLRVSEGDLEIGDLAGAGSFCNVYSVRSRIASFQSYSNEANANACNKYRCRPKFALKRLNGRTLSNTELTNVAAQDLSREAKILSSLPEHRNITSLRAISTDFYNAPHRGFLVLDFLEETLHSRLHRWKVSSKRSAVALHSAKINFPLFSNRSAKKLDALRTQQGLYIRSAAVGVARAMEFLHKHKVIYRDLKPTNIGFDEEGNVQLFDFGLARSIANKEAGKNKGRYLTGVSGTARYMAPEVALSQDYSFPADVYSFSVLLWEICALEKPYANATSFNDLRRKVARKGIRPSLQKVASPVVKKLLQDGWQMDPNLRPTFSKILEVLTEESNN